MKKCLTTSLTALALATAAQAQDVKVDALLIGWFVQNTDNSARNNVAPAAPLNYYGLGGTGTPNPYQNGGFSIRRSEIYLATKVNDMVSANVMFDPNQAAPNLYDAFITIKPVPEFEIKVGQFKPLQTFEATSIAAADLIFVDRAQLSRRIGDGRDRGITAAYTFGDKAFGVKASVGAFNGGDRANESNGTKDWVARVDFNIDTTHKFGVYTLQGSTDFAYNDKTALAAKTFSGRGVTAGEVAEVIDNKDKTTNLGAYYYFNSGPWHADVEVAKGLLGRRFASVGTAGAAARQHLDQEYLGYFLSGSYTTGHHIFAARWDFMNYNQGDKWYTAYNPYTQSAVGVARADGADLTPKFHEFTLGYTYAFKPESVRAANVKVNYINRSHNYLLPNAGETGEKGTDSVVVAFQVWF
ncbi:MAG TPA: hypothetical protein VJ505_05530 [Holophagaceae bacterium]|nr:hypothetical protein [Holophagaceae bacterium]